MEKFLTGIKRKSIDSEPAGSNVNDGTCHQVESVDRNPACKQSVTRKIKGRKYDPSYISFGFTSTIVNGEERPQCVICLNILAIDSMVPSKLKRHLEKQHQEYASKDSDFFKRKLKGFSQQKQVFETTTTVATKALLASYKVAHRIAQCKKPHTIAETLLLPAAIDMVEIMCGEASAQQLKKIPLSDNTVARRIEEIGKDLCDQLLNVLRTSQFGLQVDEATDVAKDAHLIAYVRYAAGDEIKEDFLFCKVIHDRATAAEVFQIIDTFFSENYIKWENCVGLCTDGARSMSGRHFGLQALVREKAPKAVWTHCMIHRQALASSSLPEELSTVLNTVIRSVNYIKNSPLKARLFAKLCDSMDAEHTGLLYYCAVRWLSRAKVLQRVYDLRSEIGIFLTENNHADAVFFYDTSFIEKLSYMVDIFGKLNELNISMQGPQKHVLVQSDKLTAFIRKLDLWKCNLESNNFQMFLNLEANVQNSETETDSELYINHMSALQTQFALYFKDLDVSKYEWVRNPFAASSTPEFDILENEQLIDLASDTSLRQVFDARNLPQFWLSVKTEYPNIAAKAVGILLPFVTSYLCETGFSAVAVLKTKYRSRLVIENELRAAISPLLPRFGKLCEEKQAHVSH